MSPVNHLHPLSEGGHFYKATREDGLYSAVKYFDFPFSDELAKSLESRIALVNKAIEEYKAHIPRVSGWKIHSDKPYIEFEWIVGMSLEEKFKIEKNTL